MTKEHSEEYYELLELLRKLGVDKDPNIIVNKRFKHTYSDKTKEKNK